METMERSTLKEYVRHAELYGIDCVYETAEQVVVHLPGRRRCFAQIPALRRP